MLSFKNSFIVDDIQPEDFQIIDVENLEDNQGLPNLRLSCFLHSLQLCIRDGLKNTSFLSKALEKCHALAKFSHKSNKMVDALEQLKKTIPKANFTRWNSDYLLVKSIVSIEKNDLDSIVQLMENPIKFTNNEMIILKELLEVLEPFYDVCITCQSETIVTASAVVPAIVHLISHLHDIKENISFCVKLVQQLELSIEKRFAGIVKRLDQSNVEENDPFNDPVYFLATVLDPWFKFFWLKDLNLSASNENRLKQHIIQLLLDEINKDSNGSLAKLSDTSSSSMSRTKKKKLYFYDDGPGDYGNDSLVMSPLTELEVYLNEPIPSKFSEYWRRSQLCRLKRLVTRVCSIQASSAPVERVFSCAGLILSPRRTRMNEQLFRDLVFLKVNQTLL